MSTAHSDQPFDSKELAKQRRELLLKAYGSSVDEYRFNVNLGWDQTKFYVTTAIAAIAAGVGLLRLAVDSSLVCFFLALYFLLPAGVALLGLATVDVRKRYTREANLKKAIVELELGLVSDVIPDVPGTGIDIAVTPGQKASLSAIVKRKYREDTPVKRGSIVYYTKLLLCLLVAMSCIGSLVSYTNALVVFNNQQLAPINDRKR